MQRIGSVVECWAWDRGVAISRLNRGAVMYSWVDTLSPVNIGSTQEDKTSWHDWNIVDRDVKHQHKQTYVGSSLSLDNRMVYITQSQMLSLKNQIYDIEGAQGLSGRAPLETEGQRVRALPASLCCVFDQDTFILAKYWFNPGRPIQT